MTGLLEQILHGFNIFTLGYFVVLQLTFTVLAIVGWRAIEDYVERRPMRDYRAVAESEMSMPVSILVPAYNEAPSIVASLRSLLTSQFVEFEVVVINDGSTDETMAALTDAFGLVKVGRVPRSNISTQLVRGVYTSPLEPRVVVIDKVNGGKADALNAGINHAVYPLFCAIDADTMLDADALSRLVWEFQAAPETVAVGGIVRIVNGSEFENGRLARVRTPRNLLANLQIIEYLRAFLGGRIGWSKSGMLLIISGAFGLFRRDVCVEVGGYDPTTVGEDAELVLRLHRHQREHRKPCRITFFPDPICWTECPEDLGTLVRQRDRWQRGLIEMIARHRKMLLRPRYGRIGCVAMPYFIFFELLGPTIECFGYTLFVLSLVLGIVSLPFALAFFAVSLTYSLVLSFLVILMEERAFRRYPGWSDLIRLTLCAVVENIGYRQLLAVVRMRAWYTLARRKQHWGEMTRKGFGPLLPGGVGVSAVPRLDPTADPVLAGEMPAER
ncbi:MAG TPA: glycosyltransferase [Solirubrobacterales bacterium]|nr:glycosyltransferase [Solirubrobacterales bacterium]